MSNPVRIGLVVAAALVAVVLFLVLREDDEEATPQETTPTAVEETTTEETQTETGEDTGAATTEETTTEEAPEVVRATVVVGPEGPSGVERIDAQQGQRVILVVRSQVADHVHVHGYNLLADVAPGQPGRIEFRATIPGRFEIELEDRAAQIAQLRVTP